ncbi:MAG: M48 family metalloprotease [Abditibacteriales bacterium]|nr:M48 family metalloprotease [Abditibacteriales bacterium]MDW8366214.1 M48 family metalloprotease [Abditibacteriales bacterium]
MMGTKWQQRQRAGLFAFIFLTLLPVGAQQKKEQPKPPEGSTDKELKIGLDAAKEIEANYKLINDPPMLQKLNEMARVLGALSERPKINYVVKIIGASHQAKDPRAEEHEVNAFTLPGGFIYVTKGLLNFVQSDHELAAVLAHEIAHNAQAHALRQMAKERKLQWLQIAAIIGLIAGGNQGADIAQYSQLVLVAIMNGFSIDLEQEADKYALSYLHRSPYNPVGLLTFMERLNREEERRPQVPLGIFQTHPTTAERVNAVLFWLRKMNIPINRAEVTRVARATPELLTGTPMPAAQVKMGGLVICKLAGATQQEALQRAQFVSQQLDKLLYGESPTFLLTIRHEGDKRLILSHGQLLMTVTEADAKLNNETVDRLVQQWIANLRQLRWRNILNGSA